MRIVAPAALLVAVLIQQSCVSSDDGPVTLPDFDGGIAFEAGSFDAALNDAALVSDATSSDGSPLDGGAVDASTDAASDSSADAAQPTDGGCVLPQVQGATGCVTPLVLFRGGGISGPAGGRDGIDALCASARTSLSIAANSASGFVSVSDADEIRDLPTSRGFATNVPIVGPTGKIIANDWADLLDGTIGLSLQDADVLQPATAFWYSGSTAAGALTNTNCGGFTGVGVGDGTYGYYTKTDDTWIDIGTATCGLSGYSFLCLGF